MMMERLIQSWMKFQQETKTLLKKL